MNKRKKPEGFGSKKGRFWLQFRGYMRLTDRFKVHILKLYIPNMPINRIARSPLKVASDLTCDSLKILSPLPYGDLPRQVIKMEVSEYDMMTYD